VAETIFCKMDRKMLPGLLERRIDRHVGALQRWSSMLAMEAQTLNYRKLDQKLQEAERPQEVIGEIRAFSRNRYKMDDALLRSEYLRMLVENASYLADAEVTLELMLAFDFSGNRNLIQEYANRYVRIVLETHTKSTNRVQQMILLTKAAQLDSSGWEGRQKEAAAIQNALANALRKQVYQYVKNSDTERIAKEKCSEQVKKDLLAWIQEGKAKAESPLGRFLGFFHGGR
ncbi:MAG: hypothetical protein IJY28_04570, partial [Clostridia bacterium]|nr:hypothetical protein [Clostridia bacterium]